MTKNLLIVESPAKAKTIEKYLGKDFTVKSSMGHIRDLPKNDKAIDIENNFQPSYEISEDKKKIVNELKKLAKGAEHVWLATDEDREGEAISWHLCKALGLDEHTTKRIVFREITKPAILKAIEKPRLINLNVVNAQQARRILDRLVGFQLSPVLWRKVKPKLSAGRVQSVAVRVLAEREREILKFVPKTLFKAVGLFDVVDDRGKTIKVKADLNKKFDTEKQALDFVESCKSAEYKVTNIVVKPAKKTSSAPFTTSTLQQEASRKLGYSVSRTMQVAQKLYEKGKITYMRTDSVTLSETAQGAISDMVTKDYGNKYLHLQQYKSKAKDAQEAHEAIRPTDFEDKKGSGLVGEGKLYELIWKRTVASQMADAELEKTTVTIDISTNDGLYSAKGEVIKFDGFLKVYRESFDEDDENQDETDDSGILPPFTMNQKLDFFEMIATQRFTRAAARYTEASLVKKLEELGIGRPSTYAPTISTIQNRGYVSKDPREGKERNYSVITLNKSDEVTSVVNTEITGAEKNKMIPTDIGLLVTDFLVANFDEILNYDFTSKIESDFDIIARGELEWKDMVGSFYHPFKKHVDDTIENSERVTGERIFGADPESGKQVSVRLGRYGPMVQLGKQQIEEDDPKPKYTRIKPGYSLETITMEEALEHLKLPKLMDLFEDEEVKVADGRFGPYIQHSGKFVSIPKEIDPLKITNEQCAELILAKRQADKEKFINEFPDSDIQVLNGRWGPYIKQGKKNYKIAKDIEAKTLDEEACKAIIKDLIENPPKRGGRKKAAAKK